MPMENQNIIEDGNGSTDGDTEDDTVNEEIDETLYDTPEAEQKDNNCCLDVFRSLIVSAVLQADQCNAGIMVVALWNLPTDQMYADAGVDKKSSIGQTADMAVVRPNIAKFVAMYAHTIEDLSMKVDVVCSPTDDICPGWPDRVAWNDRRHVRVAQQTSKGEYEVIMTITDVVRRPVLTLTATELILCNWDETVWVYSFTDGPETLPIEYPVHGIVLGNLNGSLDIASAWLCDGNGRVQAFHDVVAAAQDADGTVPVAVSNVEGTIITKQESIVWTDSSIYALNFATRSWSPILSCHEYDVVAVQYTNTGGRAVARLWSETAMMTILTQQDGEINTSMTEFFIPSSWSVRLVFLTISKDDVLSCIMTRPNGMVMLMNSHGKQCVMLDLTVAVPETEPPTFVMAALCDHPMDDAPVDGTNAEEEEHETTPMEYEEEFDTNVSVAVVLSLDRLLIGLSNGVNHIYNMRTGTHLAEISLPDSALVHAAASSTIDRITLMTTDCIMIYDVTAYMCNPADAQSTVSRSDPDAFFDEPQDDAIVTQYMCERLSLEMVFLSLRV